MTLTIGDYLPNGLLATFAVVVGWVFRDHAQLDESRFKYVGSSIKDLTTKVDDSIRKQADNHAEILKILLERAGRGQ